MTSPTLNVPRLKQAHLQALTEVKTQVNHWETIKNDYKNLSSLLESLPDKTSHDIMVPFGPLALMPGKLIHTNELMVHMGDSWFADITCKQGLKIIDHRLKTVDKNLEDLDAVLKNIEKKSDFAEELDNTGEGSCFEIKEEIPSNYTHPGKRKRVSRVNPKTDSSPISNPDSKSNVSRESEAISSCFNDEELMKRLDELEKEEEEEDELLLADAATRTEDPMPPLLEEEPPPRPNISTSSKKGVSWSKQLVSGRLADSDDSDDDLPTPSVIRFRHTAPTKVDEDEEKMRGDDVVRHPGHIGRKSNNETMKNPQLNSGDGKAVVSKSFAEDKPKSILKSTAQGSQSSSAVGTSSSLAKPKPVRESAISESVVERTNDLHTAAARTKPKKTVSKFKASRQR